jgi:outer membrane lipoprotein SlyB
LFKTNSVKVDYIFKILSANGHRHPEWRHMRFANAIIAACIASLLTACAATSGANYRPIIDTRGVDFNRYESDLRDCQSYATQTAGAGESAAAGALAGALLGGVLAAAAGKNYSRSGSAGVGAVTGAVGAGAQGETNQRNIVRRCLAGRGYNVLQ